MKYPRSTFDGRLLAIAEMAFATSLCNGRLNGNGFDCLEDCFADGGRSDAEAGIVDVNDTFAATIAAAAAPSWNTCGRVVGEVGDVSSGEGPPDGVSEPAASAIAPSGAQ
jgi:hypothetical protein